MLTLALTILWSLMVSFACSIAESVVLSISHAQIQALGKSKAAKILRHFKREVDIPIAAIVAFHTVAHTVGASVSGAIYVHVFSEQTLWVFSLVFTVLVLIFSEIVPKTLGVTYVAQFAVPVAYTVSALVVVLKPVIWVTNLFAKLLRRGQEAPVTSIDEIRLLVAFGRNEGALGGRLADMIEGAARLRELTAYDVMVPRAQVIALSGDRGLEENLAVIRRSGHSRFPFSAEGDIDKVEGVVLAKELFFALRESGDDVDFRKLLSPLLVVPTSAPLERVLRTFQEERRHMAIVVDEYGGTQGIVTLEDVLEEIVGEIEDESDRVDPSIVRRAPGVFSCRGSAETRKVFDLLNIESESEMVTLAGFVAELVGRVPRVGDNVEWEGHRFSVTRASARRAERIEVRRLQS
ncbi:MAG TPA: hemolysin family protein [Polyangiaceae bacterium]|nr:hemolysin family protein [Polyangiaceae bacterium]